MKRTDLPTRNLSNPSAIFFTLLLIILLTEMLVMYLLPFIMTDTHRHLENIADSLLLTIIVAPIIWKIIAKPLRDKARNEITRTRAVLENIEDAVINFNGKGQIESLNLAAERVFGYAAQEIVGQGITRIIPQMTVEMAVDSDALDFGIRSPEPATGFLSSPETVGCHKTGTFLPIQISISKLHIGGQWTFIAIIQDITERKHAEIAMAEQKDFIENLLQNSSVPTFVVSPEHRVLIWNRACEKLTGIRAESIIGKDETWKAFYDHKRPVLADFVINGTLEQTSEYYHTFEKSSLIPEGVQAESWYKNLNGRDRYIFFNAAPIRNTKGELIAVIETLEDITERKLYEKQLEYQANHDGLTGLPNRNLLSDRVHQALLMAHRNRQLVAVLFIDLDNFKLINDTLGHDIGDQLLKLVAERLACCVRSGDTVARQGGDEFALIISELNAAHDVNQIVTKIMESVSEPFSISKHELIITCSIGISIYPKDGSDIQTLMKNADVAMYKVKEQGRNNFQFFTEEMNVRSLARMTMERHLRRALEKNELLVYYQPKVNLRSGQITGMEALIRWQSHDLGMVSPGKFIPLAEETDLIVPIGEWVIRTACAQIKNWQDAGLPLLGVAANLSAQQLRKLDIVAAIGRILQETGLDPRYLELEITESMVMHNPDMVAATLNELKDMGISLAMDDFGTGYSSLNYLKRFPFNKLKIDKSFVRDITTDPDSAAIAKTVIAMAHSLHLEVIAEGVETEGQLNYLYSHDCDEMQGYYFSRPIPAPEFEALLREDRHLQLTTGDSQGPDNTILVVDDDTNVTAGLQRVLHPDGYRVLIANSAAEGFELLAVNKVSVVLSDQWMLGMNGIEFLRRVKELYPDIVRLILSGRADLDSVTNAINQGAVFKFLQKPCQDNLIRETISKAFKLYESQRGRLKSD